ncbi:FecCD family ABC transporter permease [Kurthia sibirica]|uniref:Iron ABC transporter permease n=1 Tax=Kurthia sibirica TaxID=202750 RepID=A0A2U3AR64_9BACL|nr:iron ABC transporter permease [Kurthia sibirica]PWI27050.1 iron ABC transporter permease [Kurthia sibirica]
MMLLLLVSMIVIGLSVGYSSLGITQLFSTFIGNGKMSDEFILFSVRLPRVVILLLAGMALAVSGSLLQTLTKNDLADPGIIGINAGAGIGITVVYLFARDHFANFAYALPIVGFLSAIATAFLIYLFSYEKSKGIQPFRLVLVGVGFAAALSGLMIMLISSAERSDVAFISSWLAGNVWGADWPFVWALLPWLVILVPFVLYRANSLNILGLSEHTAIGLGASMNKERILLLVIAVALAAAAVSVTGGIGFVGLMAPHIAKSLVGPKHQRFLPVALLIGAILLLIADVIGRSILTTSTIPVGIVVAIIGAPYFLYLLKKQG